MPFTRLILQLCLRRCGDKKTNADRFQNRFCRQCCITPQKENKFEMNLSRQLPPLVLPTGRPHPAVDTPGAETAHRDVSGGGWVSTSHCCGDASGSLAIFPHVGVKAVGCPSAPTLNESSVVISRPNCGRAAESQ